MCMKVPIVKAPEVGKFLNFGKKRKRRQLDEPFDLEDDDFEKAFQKLALADEANSTSTATTTTTKTTTKLET